MARGRIEPEIVVKSPEGKPKPTQQSLEDRVRGAAEAFYSERSADVERLVIDALEQNYGDILRNEIGFQRDTWSGGLRLEGYSTGGKLLRERAQSAAIEVINRLDFSKVELTQSQINAVHAAYQRELRDAVVDAARGLARQDAESVAAKILGMEV